MSRNIKEIGKELLGKSLNSYHRKTGLTQLEENNKMQDGILDGILSQVDDAYIEKTEQSNVIHLDGSGDGVVVLGGIEGNTMVNYIYMEKYHQKDSSITVEKNKIMMGTNADAMAKKIDFDVPVKDNSNYTIIFTLENSDSNNGIRIGLCNNKGSTWTSASNDIFGNGVYILKINSNSNSKYLRIHTRGAGNNIVTQSVNVCNLFFIEGHDIVTEKEIPSYFEGLQSSFEEQVEEDKYKIEILMKNKNLLDLKNPVDVGYTPAKMEGDKIVLNSSGVEGERISMAFPVYMKKGSTYRFSYSNIEGNSEVLGSTVQMHPNLHPNGQFGISTKNPFTWDKESGIYYARIYNMYVAGTVKANVQLEENSVATTYVEPKQNKIKLLLDEPLRNKDKLCIKDGKIVVERNSKQSLLDGNLNWAVNNSDNEGIYSISTTDLVGVPKGYIISDKLPTTTTTKNEGVMLGITTGKVMVCIDRNKLTNTTLNGMKQYLNENPMQVVFDIETYYEEVVNEYGEPILLEGYENGTLYIDSTIVPTTTVRYTPKMESFKTLNEVSDNNTMLTNDINDNIIPYMMDVDMMILEKEMALMSHQYKLRRTGEKDMTSMQKRTQDMLERLIKGKTLTEQECKTRVTTYLHAGKITDEQAEELMLLIDEVYA